MDGRAAVPVRHLVQIYWTQPTPIRRSLLPLN
jgi:hypothetical protein